jgi:hypothetical protein
MEQKLTFRDLIPRGILSLIAILLVFVLLAMFIWLWYDLKLTAIERYPSISDTSKIYTNHIN